SVSSASSAAMILRIPLASELYSRCSRSSYMVEAMEDILTISFFAWRRAIVGVFRTLASRNSVWAERLSAFPEDLIALARKPIKGRNMKTVNRLNMVWALAIILGRYGRGGAIRDAAIISAVKWFFSGEK